MLSISLETSLVFKMFIKQKNEGTVNFASFSVIFLPLLNKINEAPPRLLVLHVYHFLIETQFYYDRLPIGFHEAAAIAAATAAAASAALDALANIDFSDVNLSDPAALQETQNQVSGTNLLFFSMSDKYYWLTNDNSVYNFELVNFICQMQWYLKIVAAEQEYAHTVQENSTLTHLGQILWEKSHSVIITYCSNLRKRCFP